MDMTLADQIASAYDLPHAQARGIVIMMESKVEAERERCAKMIEQIGAASPLVRECSGGAALAAVIEVVIADVCKRLADLIRNPAVGK